MRSTLFEMSEDEDDRPQDQSGEPGDGQADHHNFGDHYSDPTDHWRSRSTGQFVQTPRD